MHWAEILWLAELENMQVKNVYRCTIPETLETLGVIDSEGEFIVKEDEEDEEEEPYPHATVEACKASGDHLVDVDANGCCEYCGGKESA
jgi:hypothetical protein